MAKRATRAEWLERVRSWKASGKSRVEFAKKKDYSERALGWWAWKLGSEGEDLKAKPMWGSRAKRGRAQKPRPLELVELVTRSEPTVASLRLRVGAVELLVDHGFDRDLLGGVLDVLEARR